MNEKISNAFILKKECIPRHASHHSLRSKITISGLVSTGYPILVPVLNHKGSLTTISKRHLSFSSVPAILLPPVVFTGLLITLWTYKCLMMIIFQNRIIYMPSMPPFSRSEKVAVYETQCLPVSWNEIAFQSLDGTGLVALEGHIPHDNHKSKEIIILYFQGNGSSTPPRLPDISRVLLQAQKRCPGSNIRMIALSYRGFWKSRGRPSQKGIEMDAQALLNHVSRIYTLNNCSVVLWGQSIGAGVATTALATWLANTDNMKHLRIDGLLLETPFTGLRSMLVALYPQRFLPYRYLGPFLMSHWDSVAALNKIGAIKSPYKLKCLLLEAGSDELVPIDETEKLLDVCKRANIETQHQVVPGAFHTNVMSKSSGRKRIVDFLDMISRQGVVSGT